MKARQLLRRLRQAGCDIDPRGGKGGHYKVRYQGRSTVVPVHGAADLGPDFIRRICKQLGLDPDKVL